MKKFKKILAVSLAVVIAISSMSISAFAMGSDEIPEGLPDGAYKVYDGIYAVDSDVNGIFSSTSRIWESGINIGTVQPDYISQPSSVSNVVINSGHKWLCIRSSAYMRINFVYDHTSVFGANKYNWPAIGSSPSTIYYIDVDFYDFSYNVGYQMQCTSANGTTYNNVTIDIRSAETKITQI